MRPIVLAECLSIFHQFVLLLATLLQCCPETSNNDVSFCYCTYTHLYFNARLKDEGELQLGGWRDT